MRMYQHNNGSYSLDQTRYTSNIIHKYNPKTCPWDLPQHRTTQAPPEDVYSKENKPSSKEEEDAMKEKILVWISGRSTTDYYIFYQGGAIEGNSQVNVPIAMSSAESEYMAACSVCMTAAHVHMVAYDFNFLGTLNYDKIQVALPNPPTVIMCDNQAAVHMAKHD
eukprot:11907205-Ditylum_brightwellii.AAC.1